MTLCLAMPRMDIARRGMVWTMCSKIPSFASGNPETLEHTATEKGQQPMLVALAVHEIS
jgi:hypothetical protein